MKSCPRCKKEYEDTWKVCLRCNADLVDSCSPGKISPQVQTAISEIKNIREEIAGLNKRLDLIEGVLSGGAAVSDKPDVAVKREEPKKQAQNPVFKYESPAAPKWPKKSMAGNFEQVLGEKWFNKLGVLAVVIGVALLVGYSFRYMGPAGKIGIGFAFGIGMLIFGHLIEKKEDFSKYGKGLIAGGWAISYFTAFAMHHIPAVRLIHSPLIGMGLLLTVSVFTIADIYRYRSQTATAFSYLLTFITLMITPVSFYTMAAAVPVAASLIFFMYKMEWLEFGLYGMAMTYTTYMAWFKIAEATRKTGMTEMEFFAAAAFLSLYWAIFAASVLIVKKDGSRSFRAAFIDLKLGYKDLIHAVNAIAVSFIGYSLLSSGFMKYLQPALALACGLYLALTILTRQMKMRSLSLISSTAAVLFAAIFLSISYSGYQLTVAYIVLAEIVLSAGILLKESYWRILSFASLIAIVVKLLAIDSFVVKNTSLGAHLSARTILFAFAFIAYLVNHMLYLKLKKRNGLTGIEADYPDVLSYGYPVIYAMGTWLDLPKVLTAPCWIILGVILLQIGVTKNNYHQRIQGYVLGLGAFARLLMSNMLVTGGISIFSYRVLTSIPVLMALCYYVMLLREKNTQGIMTTAEKKMIFIFPYAVFIIIMFLVWYEAPKDIVAPIWGVIAVAYSLKGIRSEEKYYISISSIAAILASARAIFVNLFQGKYLVGADGSVIFPVITVAALYAGNVLYLSSKTALTDNGGGVDGRIKKFLRSPRLVYSLSATLLLTVLLIVKLQGVLLTVSLVLEGMLLILAGVGVKEKHWRIFGLAILLLTLGKAFLVDLRQLSTIYYILCLIGLGLSLLFISYIYTKNKDKFKRLI